MIDEKAMSILNDKGLTIPIKDFAKICKGHIRNDYDCVIAVTSIWEGDGKSTLAIQGCREIDGKFTLTRNMLYSPTVQAMQKMLLGLPEFSAINADEAIKILYKLKWSDKLSIYLNQLYALSRQEHHVSFLCMPRFKDFQEFFRNHKIKFWVHVIERGVAMISEKDWSQYCKDPWWMDENQKILDTYRRGRRIHSIDLYTKLKMYTKVRGFICFLIWDDLELEIRKEYNDLKKKNKYAEMNVTTTSSEDQIELIDTAQDIADHLPDYVRETPNTRTINVYKIMNKKHLSIRKSQQTMDIVEDILKQTPTHTYANYLYKKRPKIEISDQTVT